MSDLAETALLPDWRIYRGDGRQHSDWTLPEPPPWRPQRARRPDASRPDTPAPSWSSATLEKGRTYQSDPEIILMVNAALHLRRPLLITGGPGTGKSSLIDAVAYELNLGEPLRWAVTSRSTLRDALYSYDAIGRAQRRDSPGRADAKLEDGDFIELGPLGTAMLPALRPRALLIDEIDKADIDLPNDMLNVIDEGHYHIPELSRLATPSMQVRTFGQESKVKIVRGKVESYEFPFVVMTSNDERDFPAPFLRRCLQLKMPDPWKNKTRLEGIVAAHLGPQTVGANADLIANFVLRATAGEVLATDQLLNAIQLVMGAYAMSDDDRKAMVTRLTAGLGRNPG